MTEQTNASQRRWRRRLADDSHLSVEAKAFALHADDMDGRVDLDAYAANLRMTPAHVRDLLAELRRAEWAKLTADGYVLRFYRRGRRRNAINEPERPFANDTDHHAA